MLILCRTLIFNRKGFFGINAQAICDANKLFLWCSVATCGSTHDSTAFFSTRLFSKLQNQRLRDCWTIVADEAYGLSPNIVTPYSGSNLSKDKDSFNFYQSRLRINIECAFGILVRRWGILWRNIDCCVSKVPLIVTVCMKLHNICEQHRLEARTCFEDGRWLFFYINNRRPTSQSANIQGPK